MKHLLWTLVKRGEPMQEWISAADQATDQGRADFAARQEKRRIVAQKASELVKQETEANQASVQSIFDARRRGIKV